ncbi:LysE/ArgO family amino acid transporter [Parafrigoribacterium soli]|uniref:LysE/ArgO family amino acid transporter n=1 Tax=Parafrigoribacterium soli TaxID=3144663 RepID=UPI0032EDABFF
MIPATVLLPLAAGLGLGLSLIVAIGAQNAFVLRQGIRAKHVFAVVSICAVSDLVLIFAGISGIGLVIGRFPAALVVIRWLGAAFLVGYGVLAARRAFLGGRLEVEQSGNGSALRSIVLTTLALTWLNPHVYLDTVLLLGSVANTHGDVGRWWFGLGAGIGSIIWFTALGYGARLLSGVFAKPLAWRILDGVIAATMIVLGVSLVVAPLGE